MTYLLDTHTWIWWHLTPEKLSTKVRRLTTRPKAKDRILLSAISLWEFCKLIEKKRLGVACDPMSWIERALRMPHLQLLPLSPAIAVGSTSLPQPFHQDPADQMIVATARQEKATLLTCDKKILSYPHVKTLW